MENAKAFFSSVVKPTTLEFIHEPSNIRRGMLSAIVINHLIDYLASDKYPDIFSQGKRQEMQNKIDEKRLELTNKCKELMLINDISDASKHAKLALKKGQTSRIVSDSKQITATPGLFQAPFGEGGVVEATRVIINLQDGTTKELLPIIQVAFNFFETELSI